MNARILCALAIVGVAGAASVPAAATGDPNAGAVVWSSICASCHGAAPQLLPASKAAYSPSVITNAIATVPPMGRLHVNATDIDNVAAFIGSEVNLTRSYQGLWWAAPAASESGWGINLNHEYNTIFATWFTYDAAGKGMWLVVTAQPGVGVNANTYTGNLYTTTGPAFNAQPFDPNLIKATQVGAASFTFTDSNTATFSYTVNGLTQLKTITREVFGTLPTCLFIGAPDYSQTTNFQDLWWIQAESGWGINLTQQGDTIFATWFTYDLDGSQMWLVVTAPKTGPNVYAGKLYRTTGPAFSSVPFDPQKIIVTEVGSATFAFTDGNNATFAYTVNGIAGEKEVTRETFRIPVNLCQ